MDDIRRQDLRLFAREFLALPRVILSALATLILYGITLHRTEPLWYAFFVVLFAILVVAGLAAFNASIGKRFLNRRYEALWKGCQDRLQRFHDVLRRSRRSEVGDLREMPHTVQRIAESLYVALRRADMVAHEVMRTEKNLYSAPPAWSAAPVDAQSKELYRIADKNIAEYRHQFAGLMAGVERAEAQSAVFMTTLDTLRMKMLGYHLVGRSPEMPSQDFLEAISEAKLQLSAIDAALDELELGPYPKQVTVVPDRPEDTLRAQLSLATPPPIPPGMERPAEHAD